QLDGSSDAGTFQPPPDVVATDSTPDTPRTRCAGERDPDTVGGCMWDDDCANNTQGHRHCDPRTGACVQCCDDPDCPAAQMCTRGACVPRCQPTSEVCNGIDDDCDGVVDGPMCVCHPGTQQDCYPGPQGTAGHGPCHHGRQTCATTQA